MALKLKLSAPGIAYEPQCVNINSETPTYRIELMKALNWYSAEREKKDAYKYLREWVKSEHKELLPAYDKLRDTKIFPTWGWLARIDTRGANLAPNDIGRIHNYVIALLKSEEKEVAPVVVVAKVAKPSILDLMQDKIREYLGEVIEGEIDQFFINGLKSNFSVYNDLKHRQLSPHYAKAVVDLIQPKLIEIESLEDDEQLKEGYKFLGKRGQTQYATFLKNIIADAEKYGAFKKADRKPRVKKAKAPILQVAKLKYQVEDIALGIKSVHPTEIINAQQVWILNTKTRKLQMYQSSSTAGFGVRGTSLLGYDPELSIQKTVRKPAEAVKSVQAAGKILLRKIMADISAKEAPCNGRLNETSLIIRVLK